MTHAFRALRYPNYRLFFTGQSVSLIGTWLQNVGLSWLVFRLTNSSVLLGTVNFAMLIPAFFLSPIAGVWVDRMETRRLLIVTQSLMMVLAGILAGLVLTNTVQVWHIMVIAVSLGLVGAIDTPGRQTLVVHLVEERADLANAIALNSFQFNLARLAGPAIAGLLISVVGEGWCFALNSASYIGALVALSLMRIKVDRKAAGEVLPVGKQMRQGASYVRHHRPIVSLLVLLGFMSAAGGAYSVLLPVFAKDVYHGDSSTLGWLYTAVGVGAVIGGFQLAAKRSVLGLGKVLVLAVYILAAGLIAVGYAPGLTLGLLALPLVGYGAMSHMAATNTLVQTLVDDGMRGRVMAYYTMSFMGAMPVGSLIGGALSSAIGPTNTIVAAGAVVMVCGIVFQRALPALRDLVRAIYVEKGIIPDPTIAPADSTSRPPSEPHPDPS